jgi:hypothetical protein
MVGMLSFAVALLRDARLLAATVSAQNRITPDALTEIRRQLNQILVFDNLACSDFVSSA